MARISSERTGQYVKTAFQVLMDNDDSLRSRDVGTQVAERLHLNEYELARHAKSGYVRWESVLQFYSINAVKAGWLIKMEGFGT